MTFSRTGAYASLYIIVVLMIGILIVKWINDSKRNQKSENRLKKSDDITN